MRRLLPAAAVTILFACGGGSDGPTNPSNNPGGGNAPALAEVSMVNTAFQPQQVEVAVGGTLRFTNNDNTQHNATGAGGIQTGNLNPGQASERVMNTAGVFSYNCTLHPGMTGSVQVR